MTITGSTSSPIPRSYLFHVSVFEASGLGAVADAAVGFALVNNYPRVDNSDFKRSSLASLALIY